MHPPAYFSLGADRGYLFYSGQPYFCHQCQRYGHTAETCTSVRCKNCGEEGHTAAGCPKPRKCHGCGATGHFFRDCPDLRRAYASAAAGALQQGRRQVPEPERRNRVGRGRLKGAPQRPQHPHLGRRRALRPRRLGLRRRVTRKTRRWSWEIQIRTSRIQYRV